MDKENKELEGTPEDTPDILSTFRPVFCPNCGSVQPSWFQAFLHYDLEPEACTALRKQFEEGRGN